MMLMDALTRFSFPLQMKKKFVEHNPFSIHMDTTFNIEEGKYKLVAFCYLDLTEDLTSDRTEIAAFALVAAEGGRQFQLCPVSAKRIAERTDYLFG